MFRAPPALSSQANTFSFSARAEDHGRFGLLLQRSAGLVAGQPLSIAFLEPRPEFWNSLEQRDREFRPQPLTAGQSLAK